MGWSGGQDAARWLLVEVTWGRHSGRRSRRFIPSNRKRFRIPEEQMENDAGNRKTFLGLVLYMNTENEERENK